MASASPIVVSPADRSDLSCVQALATQVFLDTYAPHGIRPVVAREVQTSFSVPALERWFDAPDVRMLVARNGEHLVVFAQMRLGATHPGVPAPSAELYRLYVQAPFKRRGVGTALLRHAEAIALADGFAHLWLTAHAQNDRALAFYASRGYENLGLAWHVFEDERVENRLFARRLAPASPVTSP